MEVLHLTYAKKKRNNSRHRKESSAILMSLVPEGIPSAILTVFLKSSSAFLSVGCVCAPRKSKTSVATSKKARKKDNEQKTKREPADHEEEKQNKDNKKTNWWDIAELRGYQVTLLHAKMMYRPKRQQR